MGEGVGSYSLEQQAQKTERPEGMSINRQIKRQQRRAQLEQWRIHVAGWHAMLRLPWRARVRLAWRLVWGGRGGDA